MENAFAAKVLLFIQLCKFIAQEIYFFMQYSEFIAQNRSVQHYSKGCFYTAAVLKSVRVQKKSALVMQIQWI